MYVVVVLHGRDQERAHLDELLTRARAGQAGVTVVLGEPGVGKTALLEDLVSSEQGRGTGTRVLRTRGVESEAPLAFAALHRLLRLALQLERLPAPQARALRIAFGQEEGSAVEPFLVGVATLSTLTDAAADVLLCVIDDAQWLDTASRDALLFAARQLQADPVAIVLAARAYEGARDLDALLPGLPVLRLEGLGEAPARRLLAERVGAALPDEVVARLLRESGGNPLALLELPAGLSQEQVHGVTPLPEHLRLTAAMERAFLDRSRRLPPEVQTLLLLAAADDTGRVGLVRRAATSTAVDAAAWQEAERAGLLDVHGELFAFRHPLVRSAVYQAATSFERRRAHRALADALREHEPDRQVWHRALSVDEPDEDIAEALQHLGTRAERRGGHAAAAAAFERAAALTSRDATRAASLFAAARNAWAAGDATRSRALCAAARDLADDGLLLADIDRLRGRIEVNVGAAADAHHIFVQAARTVVQRDPVRALEMAVAATVMRNHVAQPGPAFDVDVLRLRVEAADDVRTRCLKELLVAATLAADGRWTDAIDALEQVFATAEDVDDLDVLGNVGNEALHLGDETSAARFYNRMLSYARIRGAGMWVLYALQRLAFPQLLAGDWTALRSSADEALSLARSVGQPTLTAVPLAWLTLLAALQGTDAYDSLLAELETVVAHHASGVLADHVHDLTRWAKGVRGNAAGDPAAAVHHFAQMQLPTLKHMAATERIAAAVRAGDTATAAEWTAELTSVAAATQRPWALAASAFGRALTADAAGAEALFETAITHHQCAARPYDQARTRLAYGEFLRRSQRRVDARAQLREALETFVDLNAAPLAERATRELRASGETARKRDPSTVLELTPMELKVARLVSTGLSNKDVAAECWISPRTVAFHLRNVFAKTGVTSRGQLSRLDLG